MLTVLVDYDSGNLHSAEKAFQRMAVEVGGGEILVTSKPDDVARADRIVLPGDGAFPACRAALGTYGGLFEAIEDAVIRKARPFLGICVGMQMLASRGHEYRLTDGFGWIPGDVVKIEPADRALKVPHMGWNDLIVERPHPVLDGIETGDHAYFVHSYHFRVTDAAHRLAFCDYGGPITAIVGRDTILGTPQPESRSPETWTIYVVHGETRDVDVALHGESAAPGVLPLVDAVLGTVQGLAVAGTWQGRRVRVADYGPHGALSQRGSVYVADVVVVAERATPHVTDAAPDGATPLDEIQGDNGPPGELFDHGTADTSP
jgi:glutamine amidotransferase